MKGIKGIGLLNEELKRVRLINNLTIGCENEQLAGA